MSFLRYTLAFLCVLGVCYGPNTALAQVQNPTLVQAPKPFGDIRGLLREPDALALRPADERLDNDLMAVPMTVGGFILYPSLSLQQTYSDNIFAENEDTTSDFFTNVIPRFYAQKEIGRHNVALTLEADSSFYLENEDESVTNFDAQLEGVIEARHDIAIPVELGYGIGHEGRSQSTTGNFTVTPTQFQTKQAAIGLIYSPNRLQLGLIGRYGSLSFDNGVSRNTGTRIVRDDSDRQRFEIEGSVGYEFTPFFKTFANLTYTDIQYERRDFVNGAYSGVLRDNSGFSGLTGVEFNLIGRGEGRVSVGYAQREYEDPAIENIDALDFAGSLTWNISKNASMSFQAGREISEDNEIARGIIRSDYSLNLDYEILRGFFAKTFADFVFSDFQEDTREDETLGLGLQLQYFINPRFSIEGGYTYLERDSNVESVNFENNRIMFRLNARL